MKADNEKDTAIGGPQTNVADIVNQIVKAEVPVDKEQPRRPAYYPYSADSKVSGMVASSSELNARNEDARISSTGTSDEFLNAAALASDMAKDVAEDADCTKVDEDEKQKEFRPALNKVSEKKEQISQAVEGLNEIRLAAGFSKIQFLSNQARANGIEDRVTTLLSKSKDIDLNFKESLIVAKSQKFLTPSQDLSSEISDGLKSSLDEISMHSGLRLSAQLAAGDLQEIPQDWRVSGDMEVDRGMFVRGRIFGHMKASSHVVIVDEDAEIVKGVTCHLLIVCGRVGGDVYADEIIVGEAGSIEAESIHVRRGKLSVAPNGTVSGKISNL